MVFIIFIYYIKIIPSSRFISIRRIVRNETVVLAFIYCDYCDYISEKKPSTSQTILPSDSESRTLGQTLNESPSPSPSGGSDGNLDQSVLDADPFDNADANDNNNDNGDTFNGDDQFDVDDNLEGYDFVEGKDSIQHKQKSFGFPD